MVSPSCEAATAVATVANCWPAPTLNVAGRFSRASAGAGNGVGASNRAAMQRRRMSVLGGRMAGLTVRSRWSAPERRPDRGAVQADDVLESRFSTLVVVRNFSVYTRLCTLYIT